MQRYPILLAGSYIACELIANITAGKISIIGPFAVPAAVYIFTITYTLLDVINRVLGPKEARRLITVAFACNALLALYSFLAVALPPAPFWDGQEAFARTLGSTPRIVIASLLAYLASSHLDVAIYAWLSKRTAPWARVVISNGLGLGADTVIFITLAFAGTGVVLTSLMLGQYVVKMVVTVASIPLIYLSHIWIAKPKENVPS
ncbi:MAG TPA: queuosine precursor transporter [Firmicutes bacterium]|nr:queuosine precursor transporter [Bacillota bacterium]